MLAALLSPVCHLGQRLLHSLHRRLLAVTAPAATRLVVGTLADLPRSKGALVAENALLRQPLVVLQRNVKRAQCTVYGRALLVLLASRVRAWRQTLLIVQPDARSACNELAIRATRLAHRRRHVFGRQFADSDVGP